ncbi:hypothetical protein V9T40_008941 [Parthenolecanium corni]|uniref:Uncharacterized protein n=1 Tax=Parthenolecanium corni TaxID=536013 RepID=A0AAN9TLT6_9HEMI
MGVETDKIRTGLGGARSKPPPIPPRPQHLVPAKTMAKYSSMPDVLNGWQRDPNPDLLKLGPRGSKGGDVAAISALDVATPRKGFRQNGVVGAVNGSAQQLYDAQLAGAYRSAAQSQSLVAAVAVGDPKTAPKKLSCIPSRSHSKKKSKIDRANDVVADGAGGGCDRNSCALSGGAKSRPEISQTSWYVEDAAGNPTVRLSKCEISVNGCAADNGPSNCRYSVTINRSKSSSTSPSATLTSTASSNCAEAPSRSKFSFFRKFRPGSSTNAKGGSSDNHKKLNASAPCISGPLPSAPFFASLNGPPPIVPSSSTYAGPSPLASFSTTFASPSPVASSSSVTRPPPIPNSSPALTRLPPLPKCFTEASPLWDPSENKKVSSHSVNLSPSSSCASSSSRSTSRSTSSGGYPKVPVQSSSSSRSGSVGFDGATSSKSSAVAATGDAAQRSDRRPMPPPPPPPPPRKQTSLDIKLATLRKEMQDLRQMDLTLLSQLWSLNEAITEFRHMQVCLSPDCPSVHSSDDEEEEDSGCYYSNLSSQGIVTNNQQSNTLGSTSSRSSASTNRSRETTKPR